MDHKTYELINLYYLPCKHITTAILEIAEWLDKDSENRIIFFPGSTIGNFEPELAIDFLKNMKNLMGERGAMKKNFSVSLI